MSWDVIVFNLSRKAQSVEEINESILIPIGTKTDFKKLMDQNYQNLIWNGNWGRIERTDYSIEFSLGDTEESFSNTVFHLHGENAIYDLIDLCKKNGWQAFDTGLGQMLNLDDPMKSGYMNHQNYLRQILNET